MNGRRTVCSNQKSDKVGYVLAALLLACFTAERIGAQQRCHSLSLTIRPVLGVIYANPIVNSSESLAESVRSWRWHSQGILPLFHCGENNVVETWNVTHTHTEILGIPALELVGGQRERCMNRWRYMQVGVHGGRKGFISRSFKI